MQSLVTLLLLVAYATRSNAASVTCYGHVFVDVNGNGIQDSFELNAQGQLFYTNGPSGTGASAVSNAQGNYALVFADANAAGNNYTVVVPAGGQLTTPPATRPALTLAPGGAPCVLNATGLMNVPSTVLNTGQILMLSVFGGLLGTAWLTGVGFVIYYRYGYVMPVPPMK